MGRPKLESTGQIVPKERKKTYAEKYAGTKRRYLDRRYDRERKVRSRQNALLNSSRQKLVDLRIKDRNRKVNNIEQSTPLDFLTP